MTNKTISITCDSDNVVALNAFSKALAEMAQHDSNVHVINAGIHVNSEGAVEALHSVLKSEYGEGFANAAITGNRHTSPLIDTTAQQVESLAPEQYPTDKWVEMVHPDHDTQRFARSDAELEQMTNEGWVYPDATDVMVGTPTLDSEGLPWDARIHSTNKATVADGTWRLRRKPKDMSDDVWGAVIKTVRDELEQLMAIEPGEVVEDEPDLCIDEGCDHHGTPHVCVTAEPEPSAVFGPVPPPPFTKPVTVAPPVIVPPPPVANVEPMTFPKLMTFLTERTGRITLEQVNELVAKHGLTRIDQLSQRPELIAAFVADVKTLLGE